MYLVKRTKGWANWFWLIATQSNLYLIISSNKENLAISYLELFISQAQADPSQREAESMACNQLALLYNKMNRFDLSAGYFQRHFQLINEISSKNDHSKISDDSNPSLPHKETDQILKKFSDEALHKDPTTIRKDTKESRAAMVQLGISKANAQMDFFFETVADPSAVGVLINWKAKRDFGNYIPPSHRINTN